MTKGILLGIVGACASVAVLTAGYIAGTRTAPAEQATLAATQPVNPATEDLTPADPARGRIEMIVRNYLLEHPELLIDMQTALQEKQQAEQRVAQRTAIRAAAGDIFNSEYDGIIGNPEGIRTIVEFFDYNCGYCARALTDMQAMVEADPDLRFVMKEFPIFGPASQGAHIVSMALHRIAPDKYPEFHARLLGGEGQADEAAALEIALSLGVDEAALRRAMEDPGIGEALRRTYDLADRLQISGTPSYVIGGEVIAGAVGRQILSQKLEVAQSCENGAC